MKIVKHGNANPMMTGNCGFCDAVLEEEREKLKGIRFCSGCIYTGKCLVCDTEVFFDKKEDK